MKAATQRKHQSTMESIYDYSVDAADENLLFGDHVRSMMKDASKTPLDASPSPMPQKNTKNGGRDSLLGSNQRVTPVKVLIKSNSNAHTKTAPTFRHTYRLVSDVNESGALPPLNNMEMLCNRENVHGSFVATKRVSKLSNYYMDILIK